MQHHRLLQHRQRLEALHSNTTGYDNTASGSGALYANTTGTDNTAVGITPWTTVMAPAIPPWAGMPATTATLMIILRATTTSISALMSNRAPSPNRAPSGSAAAYQTQTFIAGIATTNIVGNAVMINGQSQLGIQTSSRRYKEDIRDMGEASNGLMQLRPVTFHYKPEYAGGPRTLQYGLIAEEVAAVYPDLVLYDPQTGRPQTVAYHLVNAMLLNEVQKQHRQMLAQEDRIKALAEQNKELGVELAALKQQNQELTVLKAQVQELSALKEQVGVLTALVAPDRQASTRLAGLIDGPGR